MLPAPISWTARGEAVAAAIGTVGVVGRGGADVGFRSSVHVMRRSRAPARPTVTTNLRRRDFMISSQVGCTPLPARHNLELQGRCHRGNRRPRCPIGTCGVLAGTATGLMCRSAGKGARGLPQPLFHRLLLAPRQELPGGPQLHPAALTRLPPLPEFPG